METRPCAELADRSQSIELLVTDVDGVMTDGKIVLDDRGIETKHFHVRDGLAFYLWHKAGKYSAILSGRKTSAVDVRATSLKIAHVLQGYEQKEVPLRILIEQLGLLPRQVCYVGDDLPDLPAVFLMVGLAVCPADAATEVKDTAHTHHSLARRKRHDPRNRRDCSKGSGKLDESDHTICHYL